MFLFLKPNSQPHKHLHFTDMPEQTEIKDVSPQIKNNFQAKKFPKVFPQIPDQDLDQFLDHFFDDSFFGQAQDPFEEMRKIRKEMMKKRAKSQENKNTDKTFDSWFQNKFGGGATDIKRREDENFVYYDISILGLDQEQVKINVENGNIHISGQTKEKLDNKNNQSYFSSSFQRSFPVPYDVDENQVQILKEKNQLIIKFKKNKI